MKIKAVQILVIFYFLLAFLLLKTYSILSIILLIIVVSIDTFISIGNRLKNLLYLLSALSVFTPLFSIFLIYLPFIFLGFLLKERNFIKSYLLGFAISFIPSTIIYLISTYLSLRLNFLLIALIFYLIPIAAIVVLKKKSLDVLEIGIKDFIFFLIIIFFTALVAIKIVDNTNLFIANSGREFYRVQNIVKGLDSDGLIPIYDPAIGMGEATYLWVPPATVTHFALANLFLKFNHPILFFNAHSVFLLLLLVLSLGVLFYSITENNSVTNSLAVAVVSLITGLNFFILQSIESVRAFYVFPLANLLLSLIISNPKKFKDFTVILYLSALVLLVHSSFGLAVFLFAACLFFATKIYYFKDHSEIKLFLMWAHKNKLKLLVTLAVISLLPLFYVSTPIIFKDFLVEVPSAKLSYSNIKASAIGFFGSFYDGELHYLSLKYPDVSRIDDHKFGFFVSFFGALSFFLLIIMYKIKTLKNFRTFSLGYILHLFMLSLIALLVLRIGGFFRTPSLYLLTLLGASIVTLIFIIKNRYLKLASIAIVFIAFIHSIPYAQQNISNIHREAFMSGEIYKNEITFIKQLPVDGRIMTYGLFDNVVDYGIGYLTGRYGSRSERTEGQTERTIFEKIHGQNSWGDPQVLTKSNLELSNYLRLGGYKYVFLDARHPIGNFIASQIYPNFSYPIYQNGPFLFFIVNNASYAEKVDIVQNVNDEVYKEKEGYKYTTISRYYPFKYENINFKEMPKEPIPLKFERLSATKIKIFGNFSDGEWVLFKEQYFSRWKAYMDNKEVPVFSNNHELILIRTVNGDNILLEYSVLAKEKIIAMFSLIGFLGMSILLVFLLKQQNSTYVMKIIDFQDTKNL